MKMLTAVYDLAVSPPTFEILSFLSEAEKRRIETGAYALNVVFQPGPKGGFRNDTLPPSLTEREGMLWRVCVAACRLLPSVRNITVLRDRAPVEGDVFPKGWSVTEPKSCYGPAYHRDARPIFRATPAARDAVSRHLPGRYATITLRQSTYWPERNSSMREWVAVGEWLDRRGIVPVWIPDAEGLAPAIFETFEPASFDLDLRLAAYEGAAVNLGVNNGPMSLGHFTRIPYLMFKPVHQSCPSTTLAHMQALVGPGGQWGGNGLTVWEDDTAAAIIPAIERFLAQASVA
jgi:hypothetical protein